MTFPSDLLNERRSAMRIVLFATLLPCSEVSAGELRVIALGGTQAPGMPAGTNYNSSGFKRPAVTSNGQVAFKAVVQPSLDTIYFGFPDALEAIAQEGDVAPGSDGRVFCNLDFSNPNPIAIPADDGTLAFSGLTKEPESLSCTTSLPGVGIWRWDGQQLELVAHEGQQAADVAEGLIWSDIHPHLRNSESGVLFRATLHNPDTQTDLGVGLWAGLPGELQLLALTGDPAVGQPGLDYQGFALNLYMNDSGKSSFWTWVQPNGSARAIYAGTADSLAIRWKEGDAAADFGDGYFFSGPANNSPDEWGLNALEQNCLATEVDHNELTGEDTLWRFNTADRELLASQTMSDPLAGAGYAFTNFQDCWVNSDGDVLFAARVDTDPTSGRLDGLWTARGTGESLQLSLVTAWSDVLFNGQVQYPVLGALSPREPHFNDLGHAAFEVIVSDGSTEPAQARNSIWLHEGGFERLVAINGQDVDRGDGVLVTLLDLEFGSGQDGSGNEDGKPSALGDNDQVVFTGRIGDRGPIGVLYYTGRDDLIFKDSYESLP